ncbi:MAG: SusC/RagA family TonB-linked outer membrane protein [Bacteroidia bacterium]|nr:SusC/RagA family TonB-linked outer membrane protein [Bacteroidia bacterium]
MATLRNSVFLWRRSILSLLLLGFAISLASAQQKTVTGKVSSEAEGPLPGVNIVLQGTLQGTMTDASGNYTISVSGPEAVLVFSFISYTTQTITVGSQSVINVVLAPAISALAEIVVTGYGTQRKREVTSSIASVKSDEFNKGSVNDPVQLIQGKVAGLSISKPGSNPNGGYEIRLRGMSTIGANLGPLVVIDGVIGGSLENVDPNDIENISVLKDGSAAAIYGTRGSSGVILVTTKKGKKGTSVIDYNVYATAEMVAKNTNVMNAAEWRALSAEVGLGTDFGESTDWFKEIEQTAITQVHNISMSGGTDKTSYRASVNYHNAEGIMKTTGFNQLNGRINLTQKALNDKFTLDLNMGATEKDIQYGFDNAFRYATIYNPTAPVRSDDAAYKQYDGYFQQVLFDYYNPVSILKLNTNVGKERILNLSLKGGYEIIKGLTVDAFYALQSSGSLGGQYLDKNDYWGGMNRNGLASRSTNTSSNRLFESTAHYLGDITSSVNISVLGGYSYQDFTYEGFYAQGGNFLTDDFTFNNLNAALDFKNGKGTITSYKNSNKLIAFFGRVNLNVNSTWFMTASARYEGSSRFGADNKWGLFPAIGGGADIAKLINVSAIDNLKLRVSYGVTGAEPSNSYLSLLRLGPQGNFYYNGNFIPGYSPVSNANADLKWERKGEFDAGFDFSLFKSKLSGSFDFYTRTTTDLLWQYQVPVPPNLYNQAWLNLGKLKSSGLELTLNYNVISKSDFTYSITLTPSYMLDNTLVSLSGSYNGAELKYGKQELSDMGSPGQNGTPMTLVEEGKPIGQIFTYKFKEIDSSGKFVFEDTNGDGTITAADRVVTGNGLPKFLIGFGNVVTYKNWDLNVFFRGVFGHDLVNSFRAFYEVPAYITSYNLPKTAADIRSADGKLLAVTSGTLSSKYVEKADFVSLDNLALGYNFSLPESSVFSKIRLYIAGNNLFYITKYTGVDPNPRYVDSATDMGTYNSPLVPGVDRRDTWFRTRSVTFGANVVF